MSSIFLCKEKKKQFFLKYKMSLYSQYFYDSEIEALFSDKETIVQMLRFEGTLALTQAENGIFLKEYAEVIMACCEVELFDIERIKSEICMGGNAAIPLINQLTQLVKNNNEDAAKFVHLGATSQDVVDTAIVLQIQKFVAWLEENLQILVEVLTNLTISQRQTLMVGRTLLQQAKPITFGLKTAKWLQNIRQSQSRIQECKKRILSLTLGGAVGSGNEFVGRKVREELAYKFGLSLDFQIINFSEIASVLGILSGNLGKIAKDISLMMQTEIGEVFEESAKGKGGSSTMPHKRNPVTCTGIIANSVRIPHLVASMLSSMMQEHERSVGYWHAEWEVLTDLMRLTAGSVTNSIGLLKGIEVDKQRMLFNLEHTKGLIYAENVSLALAEKIGKMKAHELVETACKSAIYQHKNLKEILENMNLDIENLSELFKPENSIGDSLALIDEILMDKKNG
jgi:3-carboxy-cis,cis-muconate cycloisomerase